jgi:hypothetical protein
MVLQSKSEKQTKFRWSACLSLFNKKFRKKVRSDDLISEKTMDQSNDLNISDTMRDRKRLDNLVYFVQEPSMVSAITPPLEPNPSALSPPPYKKYNRHQVKSDSSLATNQENSSRLCLSVDAQHPSLGGISSEEERKRTTCQSKPLDSSSLLHRLPPPSIPLPPPPFRCVPKQDEQLQDYNHGDPYQLMEARSVKTDKVCYDAVVARAMKKKHS